MPKPSDSVSTAPKSPLLTDIEAASYLRVQVATLRRWRWAGKGVQFIKIGSRVRYDVADLDAFIEAGRRVSTSDPGPMAAAS